MKSYLLKVWWGAGLGLEQFEFGTHEQAKAQIDAWLSLPAPGIRQWEIWEFTRPVKIASGILGVA